MPHSLVLYGEVHIEMLYLLCAQWGVTWSSPVKLGRLFRADLGIGSCWVKFKGFPPLKGTKSCALGITIVNIGGFTGGFWVIDGWIGVVAKRGFMQVAKLG